MKRYIFFLLALSLPVSAGAAQEGSLQLSLKEAIRMAVEKNLDLKAEIYNPAIAEADLQRSRAIYDPHLTLDTAYQRSNLYSVPLGNDYTTGSFSFTPGANQLVSTGGTLGVKFQNSRQQNSTLVPDSSWSSTIGLTFTQPLLKNYGKETTELGIRVSEYAKATSVSHLKSRVLAVVSQIRNEYFKLSGLRESLESRKASLELARKVLADTTARVKAGVLPAMEILNAEYGVAAREKELIDAEKSVRDQVDLLARLLQAANAAEIVTTDRVDKSAVALNEQEGIKKALSSRPDLEELSGLLKTAELQEKVARNQTLPSLNLSVGAGLTGADRVYGRTIERVGSPDYPYWNVGLSFDYPIGNQAAENDFARSKLKVDQTRYQIQNLKSSIETDVRIAARAVAASYRQLDVADRGRLYADERLKAYMKKAEVGLATAKDLLDVENDLAAARLSQITAQVQYAAALTQYWNVTGELLEKEGVRIDSSNSDALYSGVKR